MKKTCYPILLLLFSMVPAVSFCQEVLKQRPSPAAISTMSYKDAYVKITYSQPQKRGRVVFGGLVPYGEVWRTGANEATEITITKDIQLQGKLLKAGTYSVFTIPNKEKWTIIVNSDLGLWGAYNYNMKMDVMRLEVPVQVSSKIYEPFTITFDQQNNVADILMLWDTVKITIPVKFVN